MALPTALSRVTDESSILENDVVRLRSGGPDMRVLRVDGDGVVATYDTVNGPEMRRFPRHAIHRL